MPTFTAIALDTLLEPRAQRSVSKPPLPKPENQNSASEKKICQSYVSPALYTTPEATPLPDSPISFAPSPYIVNHKRRGPRLVKSSSGINVDECQMFDREEKVEQKGAEVDEKVTHSDSDVSSSIMPLSSCLEVHANGSKPEKNVLADGLDKVDNILEPLTADVDKDCEADDFFDPQDVMSVSSNTEVDDNTVAECSWKPLPSPHGEYFDADEELTLEGFPSSRHNVEFELREMRTNLLMEIEKRKQVEDDFHYLKNQWQRFAEQILQVGLSLPINPNAENEGRAKLDPVEDLCQQVVVARTVAYSLGRAAGCAEAEMEMGSQIEAKKNEINRLHDRLHYSEAVNREMSQRNQEVVERARQLRHSRKKKQKWIWTSIGITIALGSAAIAWSYLPNAGDTGSEAPAGGNGSTDS